VAPRPRPRVADIVPGVHSSFVMLEEEARIVEERGGSRYGARRWKCTTRCGEAVRAASSAAQSPCRHGGGSLLAENGPRFACYGTPFRGGTGNPASREMSLAKAPAKAPDTRAGSWSGRLQRVALHAGNRGEGLRSRLQRPAHEPAQLWRDRTNDAKAPGLRTFERLPLHSLGTDWPRC